MSNETKGHAATAPGLRGHSIGGDPMTTTFLDVTDYRKNYGGIDVTIDGKHCHINSVVGYAIFNRRCPIQSTDRARANGHQLHWISRVATVIADRASNARRLAEIAALPHFNCGDHVFYEGRRFQIAPDHNDNFKLVEAV